MTAARSRPSFALYCTTRGDYFFAEIRHLLACGLRACGARAREAGERDGFLPGADWHVVVGPQQFFYLGSGNRLRVGPWPAGVILFNAEQPGCPWFSLARRLLPRAHAVWDLDQAAARQWSREGWRSSRVPLGWVQGCRLFAPVRRLSAPVQGLGDVAAGARGRPLDLLFAGSRTERREAFFRDLAPRLARWRSVIRLVDDSRFLRAGRTRAWLGLAQRAKLVLNIHREDARFFEWHRIALHGIGQGALVLSEPTSGSAPLQAGRDFVEAPLRHMPEAIAYYLASAQGRREAGRLAAQGLRTYRESCRLKDFLEPAIAQLGSLGRAAVRHGRAEAAAALLRRAAA